VLPIAAPVELLPRSPRVRRLQAEEVSGTAFTAVRNSAVVINTRLRRPPSRLKAKSVGSASAPEGEEIDEGRPAVGN